MKLIDKFVSRELLVNILFAIAVLSLVLVIGNIFRKLKTSWKSDAALVSFYPAFKKRFRSSRFAAGRAIDNGPQWCKMPTAW